MSSDQRPVLRLRWFSGSVLLLIRGVLLWVIIPLGTIWWVVGLPTWRKRRIALGQLLGWADWNLMVAIERSLLRPFVRKPPSWIPLTDMSTVTHRVRSVDPV